MLGRLDILIPSSWSRVRIHMSSEVAEARALYSTSVEDLATECCFLVLHEIGQFLKNMRWAEVECLLSGSVPQSASEYPER